MNTARNGSIRLLCVTALLAMAILQTAYPLSLDLGVKMPLSFNAGFTGATGFWPGIGGGGSAVADLRFFEDVLFPSSAVSIEASVGVSADRYFLPADLYADGAYISLTGLCYGGSAKLWFLRDMYAGIGVSGVYTFAGESGDALSRTNLSATMFGNRIKLTLSGGWAVALIPELISIPLEVRLNYAPVANAAPFEFAASAGIVYRFLFSTGAVEQRSFNLKRRAEEIKIIDSGRALARDRKYSDAIRLWANIPESSSLYGEARTVIERMSNEAVVFYRPDVIVISAKELVREKRYAETRALIEESLFWNPRNNELREILTILKSTNISMLEVTNR